MSKLAGLSGAQSLGLAAVGAVAVAAAVAWFGGAFDREAEVAQPVALMPAPKVSAPVVEAPKAAPAPEPVAVAPKPEEAAPAPAAEPAEPAKTAVEPAPEPEPQVAEAAPEPAPAPEPPRFDLVRVEADGSAMVAGRARPGANVAVEMDGAEIGRSVAGGDGSFAQFLEILPSAAPRVLRLRMDLEGAEPLYSSETALIAPTVPAVAAEVEAPVVAVDNAAAAVAEVASAEPVVTPAEVAKAEPQLPEPVAKPETVVAETEPAPQPEASKAPEPVAGTAAVATEPSVPVAADAKAGAETVAESQTVTENLPKAETARAEPAAVPRAPAVIVAGKDGVRVVQPPEPSPEVMSSVALDTISYSDEGEVELSGRAQGTGFVRVYIDNRPVTTQRIAADGNWRTGLPDVDTGVYTLRVDELDEEGEVVSRVETPFKREAQHVVVSAGQAAAVTVQPGDTLWAISRENYGEGLLYVRLFEANRDRIRNPDLIYPGQVFDIPRE